METYQWPDGSGPAPSATQEAYYWRRTGAMGEEAFHVAYCTLHRGASGPLHTHHDFAEAFWVDKGRGWHILNGRRFPLRPHDFVMLHPGDAHALVASSTSRVSCFAAIFRENAFAYLQEHYSGEVPTLLAAHQGRHRVVHLDERQLSTIQAATNELVHSPRRQLFIDRFLMTVFVALSPPAIDERCFDLPEWLQRACVGIRDPEHFCRGTRGFVELAGHSREHVARELRKLLGKTPRDLVAEARLSYAARQLAMTPTPIISIALECGFGSLGRFYAVFREHFGVPPGVYRRQHHTLRRSAAIREPG